MATEKIDTLQSAQIQAIEANITELKTKLNLMVNDVLAITTKVNTVIGDLNDMNNVIMEGYTSPGSPAAWGILESLDKYKDEFQDHEDLTFGTWIMGPQWDPTWQINSYGVFSHPYENNPDPMGRTDSDPPAYDAPIVDGTGQGGNTSHTAGAQDSTASGDYQGDKKRMLTVKRSEANRAKKLTRQTLNRLRK